MSCCQCSQSGTCTNCKCVRNGSNCTNCLPSGLNNCLNSLLTISTDSSSLPPPTNSSHLSLCTNSSSFPPSTDSFSLPSSTDLPSLPSSILIHLVWLQLLLLTPPTSLTFHGGKLMEKPFQLKYPASMMK